MRAELLYNLKVGMNLMLKDTAWLTERKRLSAKVVLEKVRRGVYIVRLQRYMYKIRILGGTVSLT